MRLKKPCIATLEEVQITCNGEHALIEYKDKGISSVNLHIGEKLGGMSDEEILDIHNDIIRAREELRTSQKYIAVEIPDGCPQIEYSEQCDQWTPRGGVLRCFIDSGAFDGETTVTIDDRELSLREFGRILRTYAGWGMRISFVPDDEVGVEPKIEVKEPEDLD